MVPKQLQLTLNGRTV